VGLGEPTLLDVLENLAKPGLDPRAELPPPLLRRDVLTLDDLREGMVLKGTVRNVVDFGAFVDIGLKNDGLVHRSELGPRFVRDPLAVVSVGDTVTVRVLSVDRERGRIALSMRDV
jgi:protein Tex